MNGYGRIVEYQCIDQENEIASPQAQFMRPEVRSLVNIQEGKFRNGMLDSYGRVYSCDDDEQGRPDPTCSVGYFTAGELDGKGEVFDVDGGSDQGIWMAGTLDKRIEIHNFESRQITNNSASVDERLKRRESKSLGKMVKGHG